MTTKRKCNNNYKNSNFSNNKGNNSNIGSQFLVRFSLLKREKDVPIQSFTVSKIKLVKPEKVLSIENALIQAAQQGKLRNKISEQ